MSIANFGTPLYGATLVCVLPRRRALFRETGAALAPRRAPASDDPERRSLFLSRSRAPIERLPALTHPRPSPPRSGTLAYPPLGQGRVRSVRGARATRPFISLASSPSRRRPIRRSSFFFPPSSPPSRVDLTPRVPPPLSPQTLAAQSYRVPKTPGMGAAILVLDRGACPFTTKAYHGQLAGADAVMIVDNVDESLVTLDSADDDKSREYVANISVPVGLVTKATGADRASPLRGPASADPGHAQLDGRASASRRARRVGVWTNSGDDCGTKCDQQKAFIREFAPVAKQLDQGGYAQFTPHYVTWLCPPAYVDSPSASGSASTTGDTAAPTPTRTWTGGTAGGTS